MSLEVGNQTTKISSSAVSQQATLVAQGFCLERKDEWEVDR